MRQQSHRPAGQKTVGAYLGAALRHCRRASELNLRHGPGTDTGAAIRQARDALDGAAWVHEYVEAEAEQ